MRWMLIIDIVVCLMFDVVVVMMLIFKLITNVFMIVCVHVYIDSVFVR